jgi:tyrosyl-tRNA synthetase
MTTFFGEAVQDLESRDLIMQLAGGEDLKEHLASASRTLYCGFDPTAESLHIGNLVPLLALRRFQLAGHRPIVLVGGATGMIGDPSFKSSERQLNTATVVDNWVERIKPQLSQFLDFDCGSNSAVLVNNLDWTKNYDVLSFLRDIGKHFSVNSMIQKESVRQRIDREGEGISFTEFTYMILQSYDFRELNNRFDCTLQIGGSDQWGNITGGIDLTRRMNQVQVYGLTMPLITKSDGSKFGKSELGTVWLDPKKTSPYAFFQFWLSTSDADVYRFLLFFTFLDTSEIEAVRVDDMRSAAKPAAQSLLARVLTELVHGKEGLSGAVRISDSLFSGDLQTLNENDLAQLAMDGLPSSELDDERLGIVEVLVAVGLAKSNKMAREFIGNRAVSVNGALVTDEAFALNRESSLDGQYFIVKRGKKLFHLVKLL